MFETELNAALEAVRGACRIGTAVQGLLRGMGHAVGQAAEAVGVKLDKEDRTPVTIADLAVQAYISGQLLDRFPDIPLMGEEASSQLRSPESSAVCDKVVAEVQRVHPGRPGRETVLDWIDRGQQGVRLDKPYWILDPIDGTKGFLRQEQYAIALALCHQGELLAAALGCPNLPLAPGARGSLYAARRGGGAVAYPVTEEGQLGAPCAVRVSDTTSPVATRWVERIEITNRNHDVTEQIVHEAGIVSEPIRMDSQAKYAAVARGEAEIYLRHTIKPGYREKVWDHAAGVLVITEAGGRVTNLKGQPLDFSLGAEVAGNFGVLATNTRWHDTLLPIIARHWSPPPE